MCYIKKKVFTATSPREAVYYDKVTNTHATPTLKFNISLT